MDSGWSAISDCYALNVTDDAVWTSYYTDFPIVQIRDGSVSGWSNRVDGGKALAVSGSRVGLLGGYGPDHDRFVVGELAGRAMHVVGDHRLALPDGSPLPTTATAVGRGSDLHLITPDRWYRLALHELQRVRRPGQPRTSGAPIVGCDRRCRRRRRGAPGR